MPQSLSYPTVSDQFRMRETDWRNRREQTTPVLNKILDELVKQAKWTQQRIFLLKCRDQNVTPKGLKVSVPKGIMNRDEEIRLYVKQQNSDEKLALIKLELRNRFQMSGSWIKNTLKWLRMKEFEKVKPKRIP